MTDRRYTELHTHSYFSLLDGASSPEDLAARAAALGMDALALTDHDAVYGAVRFAQAAQIHGLRPIFGAELTLADDSHLTLLVRDTSGWANLCTLITLARDNAPKGEARLPQGVLEDHAAGLIALSGCRRGAIPAAVQRGDTESALGLALHYAGLFGRDGFWIELQHHRHRDDVTRLRGLSRLAEAAKVGIVATNNVHYAEPSGRALHDVLACIKHGLPLDENPHLRHNAEYHLKSGAEMRALFAGWPQALANTQHIAAQCDFTPQTGLQALPVFPTPPGMDADAYLRDLCHYADLPERDRIQLDHELGIIRASGLSNYFLIVWDIVRFAREQGIACQGRGSAANSLVAYLLKISPVNPLEHDLTFERFLSAERQVVPDIDIDFDAARREEVIQYVYGRYGTAHAAMACTLVTFRARSALRDVGKAFGLPPDLLDHVAGSLDVWQARHLPESGTLQLALGGRVSIPTWQHIIALCEQIHKLPRHLGIHNGGMVITGAPLSQRVPTEPATMEDRTVVQWDKESLEDAGLVKIDILGLRMLSAISEAAAIVSATGATFDLDALTFDDPAVYAMICEADTVGVFQVESRAQAQVLPRLKPR
ncbi:MAG TPA: DNA polymerase III subunit alpha, partial [Aggregatilineales bacterium]|nr:DNA polymerase III subunit alpha [Aggregatilineales bacterium]